MVLVIIHNSCFHRQSEQEKFTGDDDDGLENGSLSGPSDELSDNDKLVMGIVLEIPLAIQGNLTTLMI